MAHMETNKTFKVANSCVFFDVYKVDCEEITLVSTGLKFVRVSAYPDKSRFNITIPPTDIKSAGFDPNNEPTLILQTTPDSGSKICNALKITAKDNPEGSIRVAVQFIGDGEHIATTLSEYFSIFSQVDWKLEELDYRFASDYMNSISKRAHVPSRVPPCSNDGSKSPDLDVSQENGVKSQSILTQSVRTYSSVSPTILTSPPPSKSDTSKQQLLTPISTPISTPTSTPTPSPMARPRANILKSKATESPSIIDIEIDSDDDDDTENQRSLNGSISISDDHLFSYPPDEIDRISIHKSDLPCLEEGQYLNDTILGFYLKHIERHLTDPAIAERTHIFSTFFYHKLTHRSRDVSQSDNLPVADKIYNRVKNWTKNINIFDKDFLIVPINKSYHWFLAIICYPRKVPDSDEILPIDLEKNPKRPVILFMDSLQSAHMKMGLAPPIRHFLAKEWETKKKTKKNFSRHVMTDHYLKVPKQSNSFDCGLYVLQYIESFLRNPDYLLERVANKVSCEDWFSPSLVACKRRAIKRLIKQLREAEEIKKQCNADAMMEPMME